jgi:PPOX class probable F420-dependent enzyme
MGLIPEEYMDLVERPVYASVATIRPDGAPQNNPMWFLWDGEFLYFTHMRTRQKYRNVSAEPRVSLSIMDPEQPFRYVEIRGTVERIDEDPTAAMYMKLAERYGVPMSEPPADAPDRVVLVVRPTKISHQ